ncbi:hypothetical protein EAH84_01465 [Sphingomonas oligophenolica]|uniref:Uncharacterized protein n=1 Tax=Sphingomonas oligophenolica TaxID=301154 RepID=A0A502CQ33_9SPHN|nr:hypothetical protein EAH84_01465 [Sphingomonas oligophenolica]
MSDGGPWFRRKRCGLGFVPVAWPGWVMTIGFVAIAIGLDTLLRERHRIAELAMIAVLAIGLWIVAAQHSAD